MKYVYKARVFKAHSLSRNKRIWGLLMTHDEMVSIWVTCLYCIKWDFALATFHLLLSENEGGKMIANHREV
jgi:hypothetical protein